MRHAYPLADALHNLAPSPNRAMARGYLTIEDNDRALRETRSLHADQQHAGVAVRRKNGDQLTYQCSARCGEAPGTAADARPER